MVRQPLVRRAPKIIFTSHLIEQDSFPVYLDLNAFQNYLSHVFSIRDREVGGVFVGDFCRDNYDNKLYLDITTSIVAKHAIEKQASLTFTHDTWNVLAGHVEKYHPDEYIVGWYHTHPGYGVNLSDKDYFIHDHFFNLHYQVAIVIDQVIMKQRVYHRLNNSYQASNNVFVYSKLDRDNNIKQMLALKYPDEQKEKIDSLAVKYFKNLKDRDLRYAILLNNNNLKSILNNSAILK